VPVIIQSTEKKSSKPVPKLLIRTNW